MIPRIDAHQHFWEVRAPFNHAWLLDNPRLSSIQRNFLPSDLEPLIRSVGIERTVFVQTQHMLEENTWILDLAERHDFVAGVVGWVDLASPDCEPQLESLLDHPKFVGIRHVTHDEPDDDFIIRPEIVRGLGVLEKHDVPFDLLFYVRHLKHAPTLAEKLPGLRMVLDHLAKPHIKEGRLDDWLPDFRRAARYPNIYCKLSGMVTEADWGRWTTANLRPYVEQTLECFGPQRCMFGSDWPVCEVAAPYDKVYGAVQECLHTLSHHEQESVFGATAVNFYGLR